MTHITVTITNAAGGLLHKFKVATKYPILTANDIRRMAISRETSSQLEPDTGEDLYQAERAFIDANKAKD